MIQYKKYLISGLMATLLLVVVIFAFGIGQTKKNNDNSADIPTLQDKQTLKEEISITKEDAAIHKQKEIAERKAHAIQYMAVQAEGIIGAYGGKKLDNPSDNIFTIKLDRTLSSTDKVWLCYDLTGVEDYTNIPHSINDRLATGGYLVKTTNTTTRQRQQINPSWLHKGDNLIQFGLPENADFGYKVSNLTIAVEPIANTMRLVVNSSSTSYNNKAYVSGFIQQKDAGGATFFVDGKQVKSLNDGFEAVVALDNSRTVNVKAVYVNGKEESKEIVFTRGENLTMEFPFNNDIHQADKIFSKGIADNLMLETALLKVESSALLAASKQISITTLRDIDIPALDMGINNVTAQHKGYRFLPHGEHFANGGATVAIKYDRTKIPNGFTEDDIKTFYFDLDTKHWVALERDSIDKKNQLIVSRTTHFTDMINGVIQTPESPETQGFAPTMMNDIKAADPTAKVQIIAPPSANNRGSAGTSYNFEMPPARNGMQPNLGIQYSSDGGSGWLGEGWDLSTPSISVDTRWGVPRYNDSEETETYSFNGSMLVTMDDNGESSVAHRGDRIARKTDRQFYPRNEGSFSKIIRKGNSPASYTWEVVDKSGTKYIYGGNGAVLKGTAKTLNGDKEVIVEWKLSRVEELHGDYIEYIYEAVDEPVRGGLVAKAIYLKEVHAGNKGSNPHTVITLISDTQKDKKVNSARYGFLTSNNKLLDKVDIAFEGATLRSYTFAYKQGAFNTNVLTTVNHIDSNGDIFASHSMDYYDDVKSSEGYKPFQNNPEIWNLHDDKIDAGFVNPIGGAFSDKASALGGSKTSTKGVSLYTGIGALNPDKNFSGGISYSYSNSTTEGLSTLIDINGDGLPDKVFKEGSTLYYRPNISQTSDTDVKYGDKIKIQGISQFAKTKNSSHSFGGKAYTPFTSTGVDTGTSSSETSVYFSDVNNDGLVDLVMNGKVYFNHIEKEANGNLIPSFKPNSGNTPSPINGGGVIDDSDTAVDPQEQEEFIKNSPMLDAVRVWEAPFSGTIKIEGTAQLLAPSAGYDEIEYEKADGVRIAVQIGSNEISDLVKVIGKENTNIIPMAKSGINITKGQRIYFRVQSGTNKMSNGAFDQVEWAPVITYTDRPNYANPDALGTAVYKISDADFISVETPNYIPTSTAVTVSGKFVKPITSDNITLRVILSNNKTLEDEHQTPNPSYQEVVSYQRVFAWDEVFDGDISFNVTNTFGGENLQFTLLSETNVALNDIKWTPYINYTINGNATSRLATVYYPVYAAHVSNGQPYTLTANGNIKVEPKFSGLPTMPDATINGKLLMAVKNVTGLIAKQEVTITNGAVASSSIINSVTAQAGTIWIEYYISDKDLLVKLGNPTATITANGTGLTVAANMFTTREEEGYGIMYRGWGQFAYNAGEGRYGNPIQESLLILPQDESNADPMRMVLMPMSLEPDSLNYWVGQNPDTHIKREIMSSSRLGEQDVVLTNPLTDLNNNSNIEGNCLQGSGASAPSLKTKGDHNGTLIGGGVPGISANLSQGSGSEESILSFTDMNGDGFPDIISKNQIQFTNVRGGFDGEKLTGKYTSYSESENNALGIGGDIIKAASIFSRGVKKDANQGVVANDNSKNNPPALDVSADKSWNKDETKYSLIDVNGDGLPDKVIDNGKKVCLNLGYSFTDEIDWGITEIQKGKASTISAGMGFGFNIKHSSYAGGFGLTTTSGGASHMLMDINSDGLVDIVEEDNETIKVSFNTGNGFTTPVVWKGMDKINKSSSTSESLNAAYTISIPIPIISIAIKINPGVNIGRSMNRTVYSVQDVDGDGYPDIVSSDEDGKMTVYRSTFGRTNKLKSVQNPLGGSFILDYTRSRASYDHPGGKWVMHSVEVNDGIDDDGANMKTLFEYTDGRHERHEREFLGFGKVITKNIDTEDTNEKVYRRAIQEYDVDNIYTAGNQLRSVVEDAAGHKYTENVNEYYSYTVKASADNYAFTADNNICSDRAIAYTPMKYTKSVVYEGQADGMIANESFYDYYLNGHYGDLKNYIYSDKGSLGSNGAGAFNYQTSVEYAHNKNKHILGLPVKVQVKGSDGVLYRQVEATYDMNYANHMTKVTQLLNSQGAKAEIDIVYNSFGNITQKTMPANSKGQRMWYKYLYDRNYNMYVEQVDDAFGYRSELEDYDYRYGIPLISRDMNGYTLETTLDHMGRVSTITGPNEQVLGLPYTIKFEYHPQVVKDGNKIKSPAYAVTKHYDPANPTDDLETVTFVDGFGRAVQVKKDGVITTTDTNGRNPQDKKVMIVSGRAKFDPFGRVAAAYYPVEEAVGNKTVFNPTFDNVTPTFTQYDVMDRAVKTILPDNSESLMSYTKDNSSRTLVTTVTDAMGGKQSTFTNGSGLTMKTEQYSGPDGTITTSFAYDAVNQLLKAIDTEGNETLSTYDLAGRRTEVTHPASGTNKFVFDNAGNLLTKETANLGKEGKVIKYDYDFNRLMAITYPDHPENNVKYHYGNKNATYNRVGRLMLQEDATGAQEFYYGRLGELNKVRRTVIIPNQAIATYVTQWEYDSWNRLTEMIYPDLEKVTYSYNTGGLLEGVKGHKSYSYNYVSKIGYDKFEQRTYLKYCNGAETSYSYDPQRRRLDNLKVWSKQQIIDNKYSYDKVDNVLSVSNNAPVGTGMGGQMTHNYSYDGLYRLASAAGTYTAANSKSAQYILTMGYDNMHRITTKRQHIQQQGIQFDGLLKAGYELEYAYRGDTPFQLSNLKDENYRTEGSSADDKINKEHKYEYDANGNLVYVNVDRLKADSTQTTKANERKLWWDEENRLRAISDNGFVSTYTYDAGGERVTKQSGDNDVMYVNSEFSGGRTETHNFTAYVNPYMVVTKGGQYTKHIYIGSQRIVSKMGDLDSYGADPRRIPYAGAEVTGASIDYAGKYKQSQQVIKGAYQEFEVAYNGADNDDYVNGGGFCCDDRSMTKAGATVMSNDNPELFQYYYHPDHLGSTSYITNLDGDVVQHIEYVPFGEVFLEERNNKWNTPYLFNAKELDEETGLYYYGARYYDPRVNIFYGVDPLVEKTGTPYQYCFQNPVKFIDPDGMEGEPVHHEFLITVGIQIYDFAKNKGASINGALLVLAQASIESGYGKSALEHKDYNLFGVMGKPSKRSTSHGSVKDYSNLGGYDGALTDYFAKIEKTWPSFSEVISKDSFTADDIDKAFNTGSYYPTDKERFNGKYAYNADMVNGKNNYGAKLMKQLAYTRTRFKNSLTYQIEANNKELDFLATDPMPYRTDYIITRREELEKENAKLNTIINEIN